MITFVKVCWFQSSLGSIPSAYHSLILTKKIIIKKNKRRVLNLEKIYINRKIKRLFIYVLLAAFRKYLFYNAADDLNILYFKLIHQIYFITWAKIIILLNLYTNTVLDVASVCDSVRSLQKPLSRCPISKPSTYWESS